MELIRSFLNIIDNKLNDILTNQSDSLLKIANLMYKTIVGGNIIHLFGTGHSHMLVEECFFRAGGFAPVNAILEESLMLHGGAMSSGYIERLSGYAEIILKKYHLSTNDIIFIFSNSGINNVPVEMAIAAKKKGMKVIAVTNIKQSIHENSRHKSCKKLYEVSDYCIDNYGDIGDAALALDINLKVAPSSTIIGAVIMHGLFAEVANRIINTGRVPPVYKSGNVKGGSEYNDKLIKDYKEKIKYLI